MALGIRRGIGQHQLLPYCHCLGVHTERLTIGAVDEGLHQFLPVFDATVIEVLRAAFLGEL